MRTRRQAALTVVVALFVLNPAAALADLPLDIRLPGSADREPEPQTKETDCRPPWACSSPVRAVLDEGAPMTAVADAVGLLQVRYKGGGVGWCTATIIARDAIVTAYHCLHKKDDTGQPVFDVEPDDNSKLHIQYDSVSAEPGEKNTVYVVSNKPYVFEEKVQADQYFDFVVLKLLGVQSKRPGMEGVIEPFPGGAPIGGLKFIVAPPPREGADIMLFHHQGAGEKKISVFCTLSWTSLAYDRMAKVLPHKCGTWKGSSGALVLKEVGPNPKILALHYGWKHSDKEIYQYNEAVPFEHLLKRNVDENGRPRDGNVWAFYALGNFWRDHPKQELPSLESLDTTLPRLTPVAMSSPDAAVCADRMTYAAQTSTVAPASNVEREFVAFYRSPEGLPRPSYRYTGFAVKGVSDCFERNGGAYDDVSSAQLVRLWKTDSPQPVKHKERRRIVETTQGDSPQAGSEWNTVEPIPGGILRTETIQRVWNDLGLCVETTGDAYGPQQAGMTQQLERQFVERYIKFSADGASRCAADSEKKLKPSEDEIVQTLVFWELTKNMEVDEVRQTRSGASDCASLVPPGCTINFDRIKRFYTYGLLSMQEFMDQEKDNKPYTAQLHVVQTIASVEHVGNLEKRVVVECEYSANFPRNRSSVNPEGPGLSAADYCGKLTSGQIGCSGSDACPVGTLRPILSRSTQYIDPSRGIVYEKIENELGATTSQLLDRKQIDQAKRIGALR